MLRQWCNEKFTVHYVVSYRGRKVNALPCGNRSAFAMRTEGDLVCMHMSHDGRYNLYCLYSLYIHSLWAIF